MELCENGMKLYGNWYEIIWNYTEIKKGCMISYDALTYLTIIEITLMALIFYCCFLCYFVDLVRQMGLDYEKI